MRPSFKGYVSATLSLIVLAAVMCAISALMAYQNPVLWLLLGAYVAAMIAPIAVLLSRNQQPFELRERLLPRGSLLLDGLRIRELIQL